MRRIVVVVVLFVNAIGFSQNHDFVVEDNLIVWRRVYEDTAPFSALKNKLRLNFVTDSTGTINKTNFSNWKLNELTANFRIESKKGKYRVSLFNIRFFRQTVDCKDLIKDYSIESQFLKYNGEIRKSVWGSNEAELLHHQLVELFTIKKEEHSDW